MRDRTIGFWVLAFFASGCVLFAADAVQAHTCNSVCNQVRSACRSSAKATFNVQKLQCADQHDQCTENCGAARSGCRESARQAWTDAKTACDDRRASCRETCAAPIEQACVPDCKATLRKCKRDPRLPKKACVKDCPRGADRRTCVRSCWKQAHEDLRTCAEEAGDCFAACAHLPAPPAGGALEPQAPQPGSRFQLGAGEPHPEPGSAAILRDAERNGPSWSSLFDRDGKRREEYPPGGNGVPDYVELYGGRWAVFMRDDVSLGTGPDFTALKNGDGLVHNGNSPPADDLGNTYVYLTLDESGNVLVYGAVERLDTGDSFVEFEFNQAHIRLGHGAPWEITGSRTAGDVRVRIHFRGGVVDNTVVERWTADGGTSAFQPITSTSGEGCNGEQTLCVVANAAAIDGGPWTNFDTSGNPETIASNRFVEFGINAGALVGLQPDFTSIQVRTPSDIAFGQFPEGS